MPGAPKGKPFNTLAEGLKVTVDPVSRPDIPYATHRRSVGKQGLTMDLDQGAAPAPVADTKPAAKEEAKPEEKPAAKAEDKKASAKETKKEVKKEAEKAEKAEKKAEPKK